MSNSPSVFDVVVIGAGPGGYHAAIRAAQLGLNVAIVEKDDGTGIGGMGGVCLNWGCIPSKSLLKNAELVSEMKHASDWGIEFDNVRFDMSKAVDRSRRVSNTLTRGIGYLMRKNNITVFEGTGRLMSSSPECRLTAMSGLRRRTSSLPPARERVRCRALEIDGESIITSREALELRESSLKPSPSSAHRRLGASSLTTSTRTASK